MRGLSFLFILLACVGSAFGNCWTPINLAISNDLRSVIISGNDTCFIAGNSILLKSTNAGVSWTADSALQGLFNSITYDSSKMVFAAGIGGEIARDSFANINVPYIVPNGAFTFYGCAQDNGSYYACGDDGAVWQFNGNIIHSNGSQIPISTMANLRSITFNAGQGYIAGEANTMLASYNGASIWYQLNEPIPANLNAVTTINSSSTIIAVGDSGAIIKSTDAGKSWESGNLGPAHDLYGISFLGSKGVIVGSEGLILYSSNAGASWQREVSGTQFDLHGVFLANGLWIVVGDYGTILQTTGPGCSSQFTAVPNAVVFATPIHELATQTIHITNSSATAELTVFASITGDRKFSANRKKLVVPPESSDTIVVSFTPPDSLNHVAKLILDNDANFSPDTIPLTGSVPQSTTKKKTTTIATSRNIIVFSYQSPCDIFDSLLITNTGDTTLYISRIRMTDTVWYPSILSDSIPPGTSLPVFIHLTNLPHATPLTGYAIISSNATNSPNDSIFLLGSLSEPSYAALQLDKDSIVFNVNQSPEIYFDTVFVTNTGDTTLYINSVSAFNSNVPFKFDFPDSILPCTTAAIAVSFLYTGEPASRTGMIIQSNASAVDTAYIIIHSPVNVEENALPLNFETYVFPNPAKQNTTIEYTSPIGGNVSLWITNALGQTIAANSITAQPGVTQAISVDLYSAPNGVYFYRLFCSGKIATGKFILDK